MKNIGWVLLGIGLVILWLYFPTVFNWWAEYAWNVPATQLAKKSDLGPLGDLYGSLNTLISSIALCAVAYSTWLQVTSLKEARDATAKQLDLAEKNHLEQLSESKKSIFSNAFYSLMDLKETKFSNLEIKLNEEVLKSDEVFQKISEEFLDLLKDREFIDQLQPKNLEEEFKKVVDPDQDGISNSDIISSYFLIYVSLIKLILSSDFSEDEKSFYKNILSNSMRLHEQLTLFWVVMFSEVYKKKLINSEIFSQFYSDGLMPLVVKFTSKSFFSNKMILNNWDEYENQTPT